jgi:hypothetical protein
MADGAEPYPEITYGAPVDEKKTGNEKKMKKIVKEGGKRGVEIEGAADMGGLQFFCTMVEEPQGDADFLYESLKAMNFKSDPSEEERKGGSGRIGKMLVSKSQDDSKLALAAYCPPSKQDQLKADDWMNDILKALGGGTLIYGDASTAKAEIANDSEKGLFVMKLKDNAITESINYLKSKGLFPDKTDDSDDEFIFGDDDFPTADNPDPMQEAAEEAKEEGYNADAAPAAQEEDGEPYPDITYGAPVDEKKTSNEKKMKKIIKEGGKRGVEIEGAADMGGLKFFCTTIDEPGGDADLLYESLKAMNFKSDPSEEERKGGSGRIGKMLVSKDQADSVMSLVAYCPPALQNQLKADEFMKDILKALGAGDFLFGDATTAKATIKNDAEKCAFVFKLKDSAISESINYLKGKGLFQDKTYDSDDEFIFGDDDFPSM